MEFASKESSSLSLERAMRIRESGRRDEEGMVASKRVVEVEGTIVRHACEAGDNRIDGDQIDGA